MSDIHSQLRNSEIDENHLSIVVEDILGLQIEMCKIQAVQLSQSEWELVEEIVGKLSVMESLASEQILHGIISNNIKDNTIVHFKL